MVFCVHDDCEALLEGYVEPRQAAQHQPEWTVPLQHALHVSHALVPTEQEYEFAVTLPAEVVRFNAATWDIMQEWVDTLRQKLREMKIISPKENLYSRLPELRAPLLPTRDPMSPLPATPPVPAALVPGIERIGPATHAATTAAAAAGAASAVAVVSATSSSATTSISSSSIPSTAATEPSTIPTTMTTTTTTTPTPTMTSTATAEPSPSIPSTSSTGSSSTTITTSMPASAMSNTLTQNLINMLSNPVMSAYNNSHGVQPPNAQIVAAHAQSNVSLEDSFFAEDDEDTTETATADASTAQRPPVASMARVFVDNVLADPNTCPTHPKPEPTAANAETQLSVAAAGDAETSSLDSLGSSSFQSEPIIIPR